jgi:hypothetical protein
MGTKRTPGANECLLLLGITLPSSIQSLASDKWTHLLCLVLKVLCAMSLDPSFAGIGHADANIATGFQRTAVTPWLTAKHFFSSSGGGNVELLNPVTDSLKSRSETDLATERTVAPVVGPTLTHTQPLQRSGLFQCHVSFLPGPTI